MNRILFIFLGLAFLLFFSCKKDNRDLNEIDSLKVDITDSLNISNEIEEQQTKEITVTDTQVYFFMPSGKERTEIIQFYGTINTYEYQSIFNNFVTTAQTLKGALKNQGINVEITYSKKFIFPIENDTFIYDLSIEGQIMGYIFADGINMPLIRTGVQKAKDISADVRNYFNIKDFSIYDPVSEEEQQEEQQNDENQQEQP